MVIQDKRLSRTHRYCLKGQRARVKQPQLPWGPRITAIPIIPTEGLLDVGIYDGHVNGGTFLNFINTVLACCSLPFGGFNPQSIVVLGKNVGSDYSIVVKLKFWFSMQLFRVSKKN